MEKWQITIKDVLSRKLFNNSKLVAGSDGIDREVKWTHILEMGDFESLINGGELILTTGSGITFDSPDGITYIDKLRRKNIAGICVELGTHVKTIHPDIIQYFNTHNIPLITFESIVKFVDITQDLHTLIINHHHERLNQLNIFSQKVNELSLTPNGILKILKELTVKLDISAIFITDDGKSFYYPPEAKDKVPSLKTSISQHTRANHTYENLNINEGSFTLFSLKGHGHNWGNLLLNINSEELDNFSYSLIDRAILAIKQIMLRSRAMEERKQNQEEEIIRRLLHGKDCDITDAKKVLPAPAANLNYRLFLIKSFQSSTIRENDWEEIKLQQSIMIRSLFKSHGFIPTLSVSRSEIAIIAFFYKTDEAKKDLKRFTKIIEDVKAIYEKNLFIGKNGVIGISSLKRDYNQICRSYKEANDVILVQESNLLKTYFYEDIGVYRLLLDQLNNHNLTEFVHEYLGPILEYDKEMNSNLLETLLIYLNCLGSKKEAAERLYIVRQTLYHRLDKIEELLGSDFMKPVKRHALELALAAYTLLKHIDNRKKNRFALEKI